MSSWESGAEFTAELVGVRTDLMGRMDRLQDPLTAIRDDIGVNMAGRMQPSA